MSIFYSFSVHPTKKVSVNNGGGPPVPIPNTEVKPARAYNTWLDTAWDDWSMLTHTEIGRAILPISALFTAPKR